MDIKSLYKTKELATFQYFRDGDFWYRTDSGFCFPVSLADLNGARLEAQDKALIFASHIRKYLASLASAQQEQANSSA